MRPMMRSDRQINLAPFTTFRIGGRPVRYMTPSGYEELSAALAACRRLGMEWRILGGGSNLLIEDEDLPFAVVRVCSPGFDWMRRMDATTLRVGAGVRMGKLLSHCQRAGLGGLEFLAGIPGTMGGAVAGNAGAWGHSVCERLTRVWLMDVDGTRRSVNASQLAFGYRSARPGRCVITEAEFELEPRACELVARRLKGFIEKKMRSHPVSERSAGCIFKNPPGGCAGKLLDLCGLKGQRVGAAEVSTVHANFIINRGRASSRDVLCLIEMMQESVRKKFGVELELEVQHWQARKRVA